ncbi:MAG: diaminopimelate epimerase [Gammaproteobacteria bacterium]|nr:diaminopimelate epimerase [Gammaproteobacteria bacterium]
MQPRHRFFKMHVCGNDFMVVDATSEPFTSSASEIQQWSNRRKGIGFDQLLVLEPPRSVEHDFRMLIFNGDGGSATQCGNGCAAVAKLARELGLTDKTGVSIATKGGSVACRVAEDDEASATVEMPPPILCAGDVPFLTDHAGCQHQIELQSPINSSIEAIVLSMGNPHAVVLVDNVDTTDLTSLGMALQRHKRFPDSVNVEIMQCRDRNHGKLRVFERGVGETLSCGSGACAAMVAGRLMNLFDESVEIESPGGRVSVKWEGKTKPVQLSCQPKITYEGVLRHSS